MRVIFKARLKSLWEGHGCGDMASKTIGQFKGKVRDDYLGLVVKFPLTSLKSEEQFQAAQAVLAELLAKDVTQADLHRDTGFAKSSISEVLAGRKPFSRRMIRTLADYFKVDVRLLASNL